VPHALRVFQALVEGITGYSVQADLITNLNNSICGLRIAATNPLVKVSQPLFVNCVLLLKFFIIALPAKAFSKFSYRKLFQGLAHVSPVVFEVSNSLVNL